MVLVCDGDGSFNHTLSELKTVLNYNLPIKIAIMNDTKLSMVEAWENLFFDETYTATNLNENPRYKLLAESYGIKGLECDNKSNLDEILHEFFTYDKAVVCDFRVKSDLCLPLVAPGSSLDDIIITKNDIHTKNNSTLPPS